MLWDDAFEIFGIQTVFLAHSRHCHQYLVLAPRQVEDKRKRLMSRAGTGNLI
jgi:hypothetical protein